MVVKRLSILFLFLFLLFFGRVGLVSANTEKTVVQPDVVVSATIGIPKMTLWGYSSPQAVIELSGVGVSQRETAKADGYFSFDLVYLLNTGAFPELCLTAFDLEGRITPPTCIPKIPAGNNFYNVGPVLLPPTISLESSYSAPDTQASVQGQTTPNSNIQVVLSRPEFGKSLGFSLVKSVYAYYLPSYNITSDEKGNFSFNMPGNDGSTWRVFAITEYQDVGKSPKSNTLKFENLTTAAYTWLVIENFVSESLLSWPSILILESLVAIILAIIVFIILKKKKRKRKSQTLESNHTYSEVSKKYQEFLQRRQF